MIGYAGGTVGRAYGTYWPKVNVLGIELDPKVTQIGRRYFGLASNPRVRVATADGRPYLATHSTRYDAIFLDAFRQPYIPFYLTTQEFWRLAQDRLQPEGMVMANVGTIPGSERCRAPSPARWPPCSRASIAGASAASTRSWWDSPGRSPPRRCAHA